MTAQLAELDRVVNGMIDYELGKAEAPPVPSARTRTIAGLAEVAVRAKDDAAVNAASADLLQRLMAFRRDAGRLRKQLDAQGLTALAILPATTWGQLCTKAGLFRFTPRGDVVRCDHQAFFNAHQVAAHEAYAEDYRKREKRRILIAVGVAVGLLAPMLMHSWWWAVISGSALLYGLVQAISLTKVDEFNATGLKNAEKRHIPTIVARHLAADTLPAQLWPNGVAPNGGTALRITLPEPPAEVVEVLLKAERLNLPLQVAAVGEAIGFKDNVADVLLKARHADWEVARREEIRRAEAERDPIVYVQSGTAVALLAQFGDFPIEEAVVREVVAHHTFVG